MFFRLFFRVDEEFLVTLHISYLILESRYDVIIITLVFRQFLQYRSRPSELSMVLVDIGKRSKWGKYGVEAGYNIYNTSRVENKPKWSRLPNATFDLGSDPSLPFSWLSIQCYSGLFTKKAASRRRNFEAKVGS